MIDTRRREIWTGKWRWNTKTANYTDPFHTKVAKFHDIVVRDNRMLMLTDETYTDGTRRSWRWEGEFDGNPRPITWDDDGSCMTDIAFTFIDDLTGGDIYKTPDGLVRGAEYFVLQQDHYEVWGCKTVGGRQYPYFEEWDRVE